MNISFIFQYTVVIRNTSHVAVRNSKGPLRYGTGPPSHCSSSPVLLGAFPWLILTDMTLSNMSGYGPSHNLWWPPQSGYGHFTGSPLFQRSGEKKKNSLHCLFQYFQYSCISNEVVKAKKKQQQQQLCSTINLALYVTSHGLPIPKSQSSTYTRYTKSICK